MSRCASTSSRCWCSCHRRRSACCLYVDHPEGLLPRAGHRHPHRHHRGRAGHLVRGDADAAAAAGRHRARRIPTWRLVVPSMGAGVGGADRQQRPLVHHAEAVGSAQRRRAAGSSLACGRRSRRSRAASCSCRPCQDVRVGGRARQDRYQYTLQDANLAELNAWAPKMLEKLQTLPQLRDVDHRPADRRHHRHADHRPRPGRALRRAAAGDRRHPL